MRDKTYYKQLCDSWMDASIQKADERRLKAFLAATDDPDLTKSKPWRVILNAARPSAAMYTATLSCGMYRQQRQQRFWR